MTYQRFGTVSATDYNNFANTINSIYGTGTSNKGYGQPLLTSVSQGNTVGDTEWQNLRTIVTNIASHQGTSITAIPSFNEGDIVTFRSALSSGITSVQNNFQNASTQGTTSTTTTAYSGTWSNLLTFTHIVTFQSGDRARYFFNAGGQLVLGFTKTGSAAMDLVWQGLLSKLGTLVISSGSVVSTSTSSIAGTTYTGFTQVSSNANKTLGRSIYESSYGYYRIPTTDSTIFKQTAATSTSDTGYGVSYIKVDIRTNGSQGLNGDNGSTLVITTTWDEVPNGMLSSNGTSMTLTVKPPSTSYLTNTWGTVTVSGTVTGS